MTQEKLIEWLQYEVKVAKYCRDLAIYLNQVTTQDGGGSNPPPPPPPPPGT